MKTMADCLEWLSLHGRKDKLMAACLKRLSLKSEKYCSAKQYSKGIWANTMILSKI